MAFQPKEKRPEPVLGPPTQLIRDSRGVETIAVAAAAKRDDHSCYRRRAPTL